jgi:hypothetical protein
MPAAVIFNENRWPQPSASADVTGDAEQQRQWLAFGTAYAPIAKAVLKNSAAEAFAEARRLQDDAAFWDKTYRVTAAVATLGVSELWTKLQGLLTQYREARTAAAKLLAIAASTTREPKYANRVALTSQQSALELELRDIDTAAVQQLGPLGSQAEVRAAAGLGAVPVFVAAISIATLTAVIAGFGAYAVNRIVTFKEKVADYAQAVLVAREKADREDLLAGRITPEEAARRRKENDQAAVDANNAAGFAIGGALKYVAIGAGLILAAVLAYKLIPKRKSA